MTAPLHIPHSDHLRETLIHYAMHGVSREVRLAAIDCLESEGRAENDPIIAEAYLRIWPSLPSIVRNTPDVVYFDDDAAAPWVDSRTLALIAAATTGVLFLSILCLN